MQARIRLSMNLWFAATVIALGAFVMPCAHAADLEQLAKRVQALEDREEIRASSVTKWLSLTPGDDKAPKATYLGHYDDQFVRENGHWKFLRRESVSDISPLRK